MNGAYCLTSPVIIAVSWVPSVKLTHLMSKNDNFLLISTNPLKIDVIKLNATHVC